MEANLSIKIMKYNGVIKFRFPQPAESSKPEARHLCLKGQLVVSGRRPASQTQTETFFLT